ncbi:MAG: carboxypeptidase-like regulatory domain-containing protein [Bacteroidia bacterium]
MSAEAKFYPKSNFDRQKALMTAFTQNANPGLNNPLTQRTKDRLNAIYPEYNSKMLAMRAKKAQSVGLMEEKEKMREKLALYCSHFIQVFNMCVKRGEYPAGHRAIYQLDVENDKVPALQLERQVTTIARNIISGEQARVAQGGAPMSRPSADEIEDLFVIYKNLISTGSNAKDALDNAQEDVQRLNKEANGVIKKVWREVEVFYNEQPRPSMREHARRWGVEYARKGYKKKVMGSVTDSETGMPLERVQLKIAQGRKKVSTSIDGKFILSTSLMEEQKLTATLTGYKAVETEIILHENRDTVCNIRMVKE